MRPDDLFAIERGASRGKRHGWSGGGLRLPATTRQRWRSSLHQQSQPRRRPVQADASGVTHPALHVDGAPSHRFVRARRRRSRLRAAGAQRSPRGRHVVAQQLEAVLIFSEGQRRGRGDCPPRARPPRSRTVWKAREFRPRSVKPGRELVGDLRGGWAIPVRGGAQEERRVVTLSLLGLSPGHTTVWGAAGKAQAAAAELQRRSMRRQDAADSRRIRSRPRRHQ